MIPSDLEQTTQLGVRASWVSCSDVAAVEVEERRAVQLAASRSEQEVARAVISTQHRQIEYERQRGLTFASSVLDERTEPVRLGLPVLA